MSTVGAAGYVQSPDKQVPPPKLKPFDLEVGDYVKYMQGSDSDRNNPRVSALGDQNFNRWKVTAISTHVFVTKNKYGIPTAFRKEDYQIGKVVKID